MDFRNPQFLILLLSHLIDRSPEKSALSDFTTIDLKSKGWIILLFLNRGEEVNNIV